MTRLTPASLAVTAGLALAALVGVATVSAAPPDRSPFVNASLLRAPAPDPEIRPEIPPAQSIEKNGLSVSVRPAKATFVEEEPMVFVVTFMNVSKKDFTFLHTPKYYLDWKFHFRDLDRGSEWLAVNNRLREGFSRDPEVLKAGTSLEVTVRVDSGFLFKREGPQDGKEGPRKDLAAGKYQLSIEFVCHGATKNVEIARLPELWVGEILTKAVPFAVTKKPAAGEKTADKTAEAPDAAGEWSAKLLVTGGELGQTVVTYQVEVNAGKGKATETRTPPGNPPKELPTRKEVVVSEASVVRLAKVMEEVKAWELGDARKPALDAPDYVIELKRGRKTHTIRLENYGTDTHLKLILAIQQCMTKEGPK